jgi:hypothetical protein
MTQVVAAGNWSYAVVVADRRFTVDGNLVDEADDERNKLLIVATPTARLAVAFCGLARLGSFHTEAWLGQLLFEALNRGRYTPDLDWMSVRATEDFARLPSARATSSRLDPKCLWVLLAGFVSEREGAVPVYANFSNAIPSPSGIRAGPFHVEVNGPMRPADRVVQRGFAMTFGAVLVERSHVDSLREIVDSDQPPSVAVGAAIRTVAAARRTTQGRSLIGTRCGSAVVWLERDRQPEGSYYGPRGASKHYMPTLVTRQGVICDVVVERPSARPTSPNADCPCGSGHPFRRCHGARSSSVRGVPPSKQS